MANSVRILVINGVVSSVDDVPSILSLLQNHPGAYTTTRTHVNASTLLFWERHLRRLAESARILSQSNPEFLFGSEKTEFPLLSSSQSLWESIIRPIVNNSLRKGLPVALKRRNLGEELMITTLVSGNIEKLKEEENFVEEERISRVLDVYVHFGIYVPSVFGIRENAARLAVVGRGRDVGRAKFSDWVRLRKRYETLRPPSITELLLSNDGNLILEGSTTNFFVVCRRDKNKAAEESLCDDIDGFSFEVQTASLSDGALPGVIRQLVIDICSSKGIPFREVSPSWSEHELWEEAFITSSLRLVQHVETIQIPTSWELLESKTWKDLSWKEKQFKEGPGIVTAEIQGAIMERASLEGYPLSDLI